MVRIMHNGNKTQQLSFFTNKLMYICNASLQTHAYCQFNVVMVTTKSFKQKQQQNLMNYA